MCVYIQKLYYLIACTHKITQRHFFFFFFSFLPLCGRTKRRVKPSGDPLDRSLTTEQTNCSLMMCCRLNARTHTTSSMSSQRFSRGTTGKQQKPLRQTRAHNPARGRWPLFSRTDRLHVPINANMHTYEPGGYIGRYWCIADWYWGKCCHRKYGSPLPPVREKKDEN